MYLYYHHNYVNVLLKNKNSPITNNCSKQIDKDKKMNQSDASTEKMGFSSGSRNYTLGNKLYSFQLNNGLGDINIYQIEKVVEVHDHLSDKWKSCDDFDSSNSVVIKYTMGAKVVHYGLLLCSGGVVSNASKLKLQLLKCATVDDVFNELCLLRYGLTVGDRLFVESNDGEYKESEIVGVSRRSNLEYSYINKNGRKGKAVLILWGNLKWYVRN